jgi:hypothetical protein
MIFVIILASCESAVEVDTKVGTPQYSVDAIINTLAEEQKISLIKTGDIQGLQQVKRIETARITITNDQGKVYNFTHSENGEYTLPASEADFNLNNSYDLLIETDDATFTSSSILRRVPEIDSVGWYVEDNDVDSLIVAEFFATDLEGTGDRYWVQGFVNDSLINQDGFARAWDASPSPGIEFDNVLLALPIRFAITPTSSEIDETLEIGDELQVNFYSTSNDLSDFMTIVSEQINNQGIFATIPATPLTNILNIDENGERPLGWFEVVNTSSVTFELTSQADTLRF